MKSLITVMVLAMVLLYVFVGVVAYNFYKNVEVYKGATKGIINKCRENEQRIEALIRGMSIMRHYVDELSSTIEIIEANEKTQDELITHVDERTVLYNESIVRKIDDLSATHDIIITHLGERIDGIEMKYADIVESIALKI